MAKLYFHYSTMNAGKSTMLLQASHNYRERGMETLLLTAKLDDRVGAGVIGSRIGLSEEAATYTPKTDLYDLVVRDDEKRLTPDDKLACILIDEAQFLTEAQVWQLARIVDDLDIPVMAYGLRTDFAGQLFPGSQALLAIADHLREVRTICWCGSKATMVVRVGEDGKAVTDGAQIEIGGNDRYIPLCREHWRQAMDEARGGPVRPYDPVLGKNRPGVGEP